jgi:hypothetical protein
VISKPKGKREFLDYFATLPLSVLFRGLSAPFFVGGRLQAFYLLTNSMTLFTSLGGAVAQSPLLIILAPFALLLFYISLVITYRLTLHPLAKYPGPFLAKITDIYLAYHAWKGDRHLEYYRSHEKYGMFSLRIL